MYSRTSFQAVEVLRRRILRNCRHGTELLEVEGSDKKNTYRDKERSVQVEEFIELLDRKERAVEEVREHARIIKAKLGDLDEGLAGLYTPRKGHAKDVSDWLQDI